MKKQWRINKLRLMAKSYEAEISKSNPKNIKACEKILTLFAKETRRKETENKDNKWRRKQRLRSLCLQVRMIITNNHHDLIRRVQEKRIKTMQNSGNDEEEYEDDDEEYEDEKSEYNDDENDQHQQDYDDNTPGRAEQVVKTWNSRGNPITDEKMDDEIINLYLQKRPLYDDNDNQDSIIDAIAFELLRTVSDGYLESVCTGVMPDTDLDIFN